MYQTSCFTCPSGQVFDLEKLSCTGNCDESLLNLEEINGTLAEVCKKPEIYVDPLSHEPIELGTLKFPFRTMRAASAEILNLWANSNYSVTVYLKDVYMDRGNTYLINMTSITFTSHPEYRNIGRRALLSGTYVPQPSIPKKALFHLFSNTDLLLETRFEEGGFTEYEKTLITISNCFFACHYSNCQFLDLDIHEEAEAPGLRKIFIQMIYLQERSLTLSKCTLLDYV